MLNYKEYIQKLRNLRDELEKTKIFLRENLLSDLENEFSKYLKKKILEPKEYDFYIEHYESDSSKKPIPVFLLDDEYGVRIKTNYGMYNIVPRFSVNTVYKTKGRFTDGGRTEKFDIENDTPELFVKQYVEKLKLTNVKRLADKEKRELKRVAKKYNL